MTRVLLILGLLARVATGSLVILGFASNLTPTDYGLLVTIMSWAYLAAAAADFGQTIYIVPEIARSEESSRAALAEASLLRWLLSGLIASVLVVLYRADNLSAAGLWAFASVLLSAQTDFILVACRTLGRARDDAACSSLGLVFVGLSLLAGIKGGPNPEVMTLALFLARLSQLGVAIFLVLYGTGRIVTHRRPSWAGVAGRLTRSVPLAGEGFLATLSVQLDVIVASTALSLSDVGRYQILSRIGNYTLMPAQVLASVHLPALSRASADTSTVAGRVKVEFLRAGAVMAGCVGIACAGAQHVLGENYRAPPLAWLCIGAYVMLRYGAASFGVLYAAHGKFALRLASQVVSVVTIAVALPILARAFGVVGAATGLALAPVGACLVYVGYHVVGEAWWRWPRR